MTVRVFQQENTTKLRQHHASDTPSVKREPERAHTHVTHRMCVRTQITWTWLVQEVKNDINTVRFLTQTARFVS